MTVVAGGKEDAQLSSPILARFACNREHAFLSRAYFDSALVQQDSGTVQIIKEPQCCRSRGCHKETQTIDPARRHPLRGGSYNCYTGYSGLVLIYPCMPHRMQPFDREYGSSCCAYMTCRRTRSWSMSLGDLVKCGRRSETTPSGMLQQGAFTQ